jgi:PAS domain-containing protein
MATILLKNAHNWVDAPLETRIRNTFLAFLAEFALRWVLNDVLEPYLPVHFFLLGSLAVAVLYGYIPALVNLVVGWIAGLFFFVVPYGEWSEMSKFDVALSLNYLSSGLLGIGVIEYLQRVRCSTRLMLAISESRYRSLLRLDNHRLHQQRQSTKSLKQVADIFAHLDQTLLLVNQEKYCYCLPLYTELTGESPSEDRELLYAVLHPDDQIQVRERLKEVFEGTRESQELSFRIRAADGSHKSVECVFRKLTLSAQKQVFALLLKRSAAV